MIFKVERLGEEVIGCGHDQPLKNTSELIQELLIQPFQIVVVAEAVMYLPGETREALGPDHPGPGNYRVG